MTVYVPDGVFAPEDLEALAHGLDGVAFTARPGKAIAAAFGFASLLTPAYLDLLPDLEWVQLLSAGYDGGDPAAAAKRRILVTNARDVYSIAIAEDIVTKILVLNRAVRTYYGQMAKGLWLRHEDLPEIYGSTIGFLGAGSIAREAARRLLAFGARTVCFRRTARPEPEFGAVYTGRDGLYRVLEASDAVVLALPLDDSTYRLIDGEAIGHMKKSALFINVGRGEEVDQEALLGALASHRIRGAGLDVTAPEPLPPASPPWQLDNVFITPHDSSSSPRKKERLLALVRANLERYRDRRPLVNVIVDGRKKA